jgi:hypothetical protein
LCACAGGDEREQLSARREPIVGGALDPEHPFVVALRLPQGDLCTGVLVAPDVVLTAGHCVRGRAPADVTVSFGEDSSHPTSSSVVAWVTVYPGSTGAIDDYDGGVDLGAVGLSAPVSVPPAIVGDTAQRDLTGAAVEAVGFGRTDPFNPFSAIRRNVVGLSVLQSCSRVIKTGDAQRNTCNGDSGGAILQNGALIAIVSAGMEGCSTSSVQTRLDAHRIWLAALLAGRHDADCSACLSPDPACRAVTETPTVPSQAAPVPPPKATTEVVGGGCSTAAGVYRRTDSSASIFSILALASGTLRRWRRGRGEHR